MFAGDEVQRALQSLKALDGVDEAVLLSTCNRTEFYVMTRDDGREQLYDPGCRPIVISMLH